MLVVVLLSLFLYADGFILDTVSNFVSKQVCYGDLGCFNSGPPFFSTHRPLSIVPQSPDVIQTKFLLYTRRNPSAATEETLDAKSPSSITGSHFNGSLPTKIIVHGFTHNGHTQWIHNMKAELLKKEDMNVIVVDWGHGSGLPYEQATANTRVVGAQLAKLIKALTANSETTPDTMHVIGHSLGAHIAGYAGERTQHLARITGLDPADPYFTGTDVTVRLDPSDATFVDVIHTDMSSILELGFGTSQPSGHADFYPNGGEDQPGCSAGLFGKVAQTAWTGLSHLDYYAAEGAVACSHERAYDLFTESINSQCPFRAYPCVSYDEFKKGNCLRCHSHDCSQMGYYADQYRARGSMYLETESTANFCDYHYQFNITGTNNFDGQLSLSITGTKGTAGPFQLMSKDEIHNQGTIIHKMLKTNTDVGDVTSVTVHYEKTSSLLLGWAYPNDWHLAGAALWNGEQQRRMTFCAYHKEVDNHASATFAVNNGSC